MEHQGRIICDSSPLGGARFTVELPQFLGFRHGPLRRPLEPLPTQKPAAIPGQLVKGPAS